MWPGAFGILWLENLFKRGQILSPSQRPGAVAGFCWVAALQDSYGNGRCCSLCLALLPPQGLQAARESEARASSCPRASTS